MTTEPLLKFENGQQKTMPISHNEENFNKFMKAVQIWILKPQVVDRRVLCNSLLSHKVVKRSQFLDQLKKETLELLWSNITKYAPKYEDAEKYRYVIDRSGRSGTKMDDETSGELAFGSIDQSDVMILFCKTLPRQSDRMKSFDQVVLIDFQRTEAFFIRLNSSMARPSFPDDINQTWSYKISCDVHSHEISIMTSHFYELHHPVNALPELTPPTKEWLFSTLVTKLVKWTNEINPDLPLHVNKSVISMERYSNVHADLKIKYAEKFLKIWPECTDPKKFVYEDISIATYLIVLWEEERRMKYLKEKQSFVDLGCGNGLLVHILNSEGHPGKGIDLRRRKIWDLYGPNTHLEESTIIPGETNIMAEYDWLIGNHSDELTPWIPVMAFRSSLNTRYFVLPCCFHDFDKKYMNKDSKKTQYRSYLNFIQEVGETCGYKVEEDTLRIPSTKRICHIGMDVQPSSENRSDTDRHIDWYISRRCVSSDPRSLDKPSSVGYSKYSVNFEPRQKEETVRNCSKLSEDLKESMVKKVFNAVMLAGKKCEVEGQESKRQKKWSKGGVITITDAVSLFERDTLKQLKNECGGLKTLLKNHCQVFHVKGNEVHIRDWSDVESCLPKVSSKNKPKDAVRREERHKTKRCWFHLNHPDGCPRRRMDCPFAHGDNEIRTISSETRGVVSYKSKSVFGKLEKHNFISKQLLITL